MTSPNKKCERKLVWIDDGTRLSIRPPCSPVQVDNRSRLHNNMFRRIIMQALYVIGTDIHFCRESVHKKTTLRLQKANLSQTENDSSRQSAADYALRSRSHHSTNASRSSVCCLHLLRDDLQVSCTSPPARNLSGPSRAFRVQGLRPCPLQLRLVRRRLAFGSAIEPGF